MPADPPNKSLMPRGMLLGSPILSLGVSEPVLVGDVVGDAGLAAGEEWVRRRGGGWWERRGGAPWPVLG